MAAVTEEAATNPEAEEEPMIVIDNLSVVLEDAASSSRSSGSELRDASSSGRRRWDGIPRMRARVRVTENASVDTTVLASSVGSVVGPTRNAFVRCLAFYDRPSDSGDNQDFHITFSDRSRKKNLITSLRRGNKKQAIVSGMSDRLQDLCRIQIGDVVTKINKKSIGPSYNAARVTDLWQTSGDNNAIRSVQTGNENGLDTILQVTLIKPSPDSTAADLGLGVWWWRGLCIRFITPNTLASHTPLKADDELESVNNILLEDVRRPEDFETIVKTLPVEINLVITRGKARWNGQFG